jgi:hypothetical protein
MGINTSQQRPSPDQPLYVWPGTGELVNWSTLLRLWGSEVARLQGGDAGLWICDRLLALADEADTWRLTGPALHTQHQTDQADHEACYIAALEAETCWDPGPEPEDDPCDPCFGSLLGHPAGEDGFPLQVWLGDPRDDTYMN